MNDRQTDEVRMDEVQAQLRDLAIPWETAYRLAVECAAQTVAAMRASPIDYSDRDDPYDTGDAAFAYPLETPDADDPTVQAMAEVFIGILNRRGLVRIDPA